MMRSLPACEQDEVFVPKSEKINYCVTETKTGLSSLYVLADISGLQMNYA